MSSAVTASKLDQPAFDAFLNHRREPEWILALRKEAFEQFQSMKWPDRRDEDWMRSDLRPFKLDSYSLVSEPTSTDLESPVRLIDDVELAGQILSVDGATTKEWLAPEAARQGVAFCSLQQALQEHEEIVREYLWSITDATVDRFAALHAATWRGGAFLHVPRNQVLEKPVHIHAALSNGGYDSGHQLIVIGENAEATVLYESASATEKDGGLQIGGLEIIVQKGGRLRFVNLQDYGLNVWTFAHQKAVIERDASIQWTIAAMGSRFSQVAQQVVLSGENANSQVNGVMFTRENQQLTYNTLQEHVAKSCRSDFLYKSALQDQSRTVWRGLIKVAPGAFKTDGYQRNDNLMLSNECRADSIPGLEIKADDVRCTHGSTSGRVDDELIFYAQSRGFTRQEAIRMIVTGFFQQIFDRITIESVRKALGESIARQVRQYK